MRTYIYVNTKESLDENLGRGGTNDQYARGINSHVRSVTPKRRKLTTARMMLVEQALSEFRRSHKAFALSRPLTIIQWRKPRRCLFYVSMASATMICNEWESTRLQSPTPRWQVQTRHTSWSSSGNAQVSQAPIICVLERKWISRRKRLWCSRSHSAKWLLVWNNMPSLALEAQIFV